jgi:hypothetical protein
MVFAIEKLIPNPLKNRWFWIYLVVVVMSIMVLKSNLSDPNKIIALILLIIFQIFYNLKVKYDKIIGILNWFLLINLILVSMAYLFASFKEYDTAAILLLSMIGVILVASTLSWVIYLWKIKDYPSKNRVIKIIIIIGLYALLSIYIIILFSFLFLVFGSSENNMIKNACSNSTVTSLVDISFFSGATFYSSALGDMIPYGTSRIIFLIECLISYITHIILLGIVIGQFTKEHDTKIKK